MVAIWRRLQRTCDDEHATRAALVLEVASCGMWGDRMLYLYCSRRRAEPPGARPPAAATTDLALIAEQIDRIAALVAAGSHYDAREACATSCSTSNRSSWSGPSFANALSPPCTLRGAPVAEAAGRRRPTATRRSYKRRAQACRASGSRGLPISSAMICMRARNRRRIACASTWVTARNDTRCPGPLLGQPPQIGFDDDADLRITTDGWRIAASARSAGRFPAPGCSLARHHP